MNEYKKVQVKGSALRLLHPSLHFSPSSLLVCPGVVDSLPKVVHCLSLLVCVYGLLSGLVDTYVLFHVLSHCPLLLLSRWFRSAHSLCLRHTRWACTAPQQPVWPLRTYRRSAGSMAEHPSKHHWAIMACLASMRASRPFPPICRVSWLPRCGHSRRSA